MKIHTLSLGVFAANCYIIETAQKNAVVIDAGDEPERVLDLLQKEGLTAKYLLFTHGHFDHVCAAGALKEATGAKTAISEADAWLFIDPAALGTFFPPGITLSGGGEPDIRLHDGDTVTLDELTFTVKMTPGHSKGSCCFACGDTLFTGDTLFKQSIGRLDLKSASVDDMRQTLKTINEWKENFRILPGHGPETTLNDEKRQNPYLGV